MHIITLEKDNILAIRVSVLLNEDPTKAYRFIISCLNNMESEDVVYQKILSMYSMSVHQLSNKEVSQEMKLIKTELVREAMAVIKTKDEEKYKGFVSFMLNVSMQEEIDDEEFFVAMWEMWLGIYKAHEAFLTLFFIFMERAKTLKHVDLTTDYLFDKVSAFLHLLIILRSCKFPSS